MIITPEDSTDLIEDAELQIILQQLRTVPKRDQAMVRKTLERYMAEASKNSYKAQPDALIQFIQDQGLLNDCDEVVDLGAGPGDLVRRLANLFPELQIRGIDLSPGFVRNFNNTNTLPNARMQPGLIDRRMPLVEKKNKTSAISVLTLDRVAFPRIMIRNMRQFSRSKVVATLLPVVAEDDNPSRQKDKIVYTRPANRIVPGKDANEDREQLQDFMSKTWRKPVNFSTVPYTVQSSGDIQQYDLGVFYAS